MVKKMRFSNIVVNKVGSHCPSLNLPRDVLKKLHRDRQKQNVNASENGWYKMSFILKI